MAVVSPSVYHFILDSGIFSIGTVSVIAIGIVFFLFFLFQLKLIREKKRSNKFQVSFKIFAGLLLTTSILIFLSVLSSSNLFKEIASSLIAIIFIIIAGIVYKIFPKILKIPTNEEFEVAQVQLKRAQKSEEKTAGELKDSKNRFAQIMEVAAVGMVIMDMEGNLQQVNSAIQDISGYNSEEISRLKFDSITHPEDLYLDEEDFKKLMVGKIQHYTLERRYLHKNNYYFWAEVTVSLLRNKEGMPLNIIVQAIDITEKKQQDAKIIELNQSLERKVEERTTELTELNQEMENYTYTITHDLRQPLRNLCGLSEEVVTEYAHIIDEDGKYMLYLIKQNAEKMDALITDLMKFAKAKAEKLETSELDINSLFKENFNQQIREYPHNEVIYHIGNLPKAFGDRTAINQVVQNLIGNALKYSSKNQQIEITISGWRNGNMVTYQISDNGVGFDEKQSEHLFTIFKRLHTEKEFQGTGVGLAMCQRIIKKHGGELWATSKLGEGATFFFTLPNQQIFPSVDAQGV